MKWLIASWSVVLLLPLVAYQEKGLIAQLSVEVKASPKAVWAIVKNYDGLHKWHLAFKHDVIKSGRNNTKGAVHTLGSGEGFDEELLAFDDDKRLFSRKARVARS